MTCILDGPWIIWNMMVTAQEGVIIDILVHCIRDLAVCTLSCREFLYLRLHHGGTKFIAFWFWFGPRGLHHIYICGTQLSTWARGMCRVGSHCKCTIILLNYSLFYYFIWSIRSYLNDDLVTQDYLKWELRSYVVHICKGRIS